MLEDTLTTRSPIKIAAPQDRPCAPQKRGDRWRIQWIDHAGKRRSRTFGSEKAALHELERVKGAARFMADGSLPAPPEPMRFKTFAETYYIPNRTMQKRDSINDLSILRCHLYPALERSLLGDLNVRAVETFKAERLRGGLRPKTLSNVLTLLKSMLRYAEDLGFLLRAPKIKLPKIPEQPYRYLRTQGDVQAFLSAALEEEAGAFELFATAVYTGMRAGELFGLTWGDVDFENRLIRVARSFDSPSTKSGKVRHVPILDVLYPILREWRLRNPAEYVFPSKAGTMNTPNPRICKFTFKRCLARAGVPAMRFHDLRHTFASHWAMNGGSREKLQEILGHQSPMMTQRYRHLEPQVYAQDRAIFGVSPRVARGAGPNVVELQKASGGSV